MHGLIDDFAVYGGILSSNDIVNLYNGAAPDSLPASAKLLAYWNFNDAPTTSPSAPNISIGMAAGKVVITYTGTLQSATTVSGPYTDVTGATSPYTPPSLGTAQFFRSHQ